MAASDCKLVVAAFPGISFPSDCCTYKGPSNSKITCANGRITELVLVNLAIRGSIPSQVFLLTELQTLDLNTNSLTGEIPSDLGNLTKLKYLSFFTNQLSGSLPDVFGGLQSLYFFVAGRNQLTGTIPSSLGSISGLGTFGIERQLVYGDLPAGFGQMKGLFQLFIDDTCINNSTLPGRVTTMGSGLHWGSPPVECAAISASLNAPPPATTAGGGGGGGGGTTDGGGGNGGGGATTAPASSGTGAGAGTGGTGTSGGSSSPTITLAALDSPTLYPPGMGSAVGTVTSSSSSGAGAATGGAEPQTSTPSSVPIAAVAGGAAAAAALVAVLLTVLVVVLLRRRRQRADEKGGAVVAFGDRAYGGGGGGGGGATSAGALRPPGYGGYGGYDGYGAQQSPDVPSSAGGGAGLDSPVPLVPPAVAPFEYDRPRHALPVVVDVTGVAAAAGTAASPTGAQTYVYAIHGDARAGAYVSGGSGGNGVGGGSPDKMFGEKHGYSGSGVLWAGGGAGVAAQAAGTAAGSGEVEVAPPPSLAHGLTVSGGALPSYTEVSGEGFVGGSSAVPRVTVTSKPPLVAPARLASMVGGAKGLGDR